MENSKIEYIRVMLFCCSASCKQKNVKFMSKHRKKIKKKMSKKLQFSIYILHIIIYTEFNVSYR